MPPRTTTWDIEPHTRAKHRALRKYLAGWMPSLTLGGHGRILIIDSFCGPGEYRGGEDGSPIVALKTYLEHQARRDMERAEFVFIFTDEDQRRIDYLDEVALPRLGSLPKNVRIQTECVSSAEAMSAILDDIEGRGVRLAPAFAFLDPFGFSDTPMDLICRLLRQQRSEVLITVMLEPVNRFLTHANEKIRAQFAGLFGTPEYEALAKGDSRIDALSDLYGKRLGEAAKYVWAFRMLDEGNRPIYDLFFGTNHIKGLKQMKRAMWSVDPVAGARFSDRADPDQLTILSPDMGTEALRRQLHRAFTGQTVPYLTLEEWILTQTLYHDGHIKLKTLKPMEEAEEIEYVPPRIERKKRRKWSFPESGSIRFF